MYCNFIQVLKVNLHKLHCFLFQSYLLCVFFNYRQLDAALGSHSTLLLSGRTNIRHKSIRYFSQFKEQQLNFKVQVLSRPEENFELIKTDLPAPTVRLIYPYIFGKYLISTTGKFIYRNSSICKIKPGWKVFFVEVACFFPTKMCFFFVRDQEPSSIQPYHSTISFSSQFSHSSLLSFCRFLIMSVCLVALCEPMFRIRIRIQGSSGSGSGGLRKDKNVK